MIHFLFSGLCHLRIFGTSFELWLYHYYQWERQSVGCICLFVRLGVGWSGLIILWRNILQPKKLTLPGLPICLYVIHVNKRKMWCNRCMSSLHHICRPCHKLFKSRLLIELTSGMSSGTFPIQDKERMGQSHFVLVFRSKCKCMAGPRIECLSWSLQQRLFFV